MPLLKTVTGDVESGNELRAIRGAADPQDRHEGGHEHHRLRAAQQPFEHGEHKCSFCCGPAGCGARRTEPRRASSASSWQRVYFIQSV
jgi:hypothetical protein